MPRKAIPETVWQKIRNDWAAGVPITTLADVYGISKQTVYNKKAQEQWDLPLTKAEKSIKKAQEAAEGRVVEYIEQTEKSMKGILERHKNISERIAGLLDDVVSKIENMDESPQKVLHALKTASDVASTLQKNERRSWGMDEKQGVSTLEDFLDKQEGKLTVINGDQ
tara:strand:+ start:104 stop:604 length:501 start_codon:yes stop_codon:yes gene_type:complete